MSNKNQTLKELRNKIDAVDKKMLLVLSERFRLTKMVGKYKAVHHLPVQDKKRENEIIKKRSQLVKKMSLDGKLIASIFKLIFKKVRQNHKGSR